MIPKIITYKWISDKCCKPQAERFKKVFGEKVELSRKALLKAARTGQKPSFLRGYLNSRQIIQFDRLTDKAMNDYFILDKISLQKYQTICANAIADILKLDT